MSKFEKLFKQIVNENITHEIDPRKIIASVGWEVTDGLITDIYDFSLMDEEGNDEVYQGWLEDMPPEKIDFKSGAKEVMNYAKEQDASPEELSQLKQALIELGKKYQGHTFFLYGIESDLSLGVL